MCGVTGWFSPSPIHATEAHPPLSRMIKQIHHRGPDGEGMEFFDHAVLGHVRLAIIDPMFGAQPMYSHDKRYCISFNGEIYNYRDLKAQLTNQGHHFSSNSDTEVIMALYRAYGWQGFTQLRGMYAFALWDCEGQTGLLVRDPLGIKPLFIHQKGNQLTFASEAKAILAKKDISAQLNPEALHLLLNFRYLPGNRSLFKDIQQLPAGTVLEWSATSIQHYPLPETNQPDGETLEILAESVRLHLTSDVEVGAYLSGGIDSATIVALSRQHHPSLRTFTLNVGDDPKEAEYAARSAALLGVENIQGDISADLSQQLMRMTWHLETPKINALQVSQLAQLTARHVKVALSGLGGDELFLGYNAHKIMALANKAHHLMPGLISSTSGTLAAGFIAASQRTTWSETERALRMLQHLGHWPHVYGLLRNLWDSPNLRRRIYGPRMLDSQLPNAFTILEQLWPDENDPVMAMAQFELKNKMVNDLLWQEDRVSMAEGLEVRVPFVDKSLIAHLQHFQREQLMINNKPKGYLRTQLKEILPDEILARPKSGFQINSPAFYHQHLKPLATVWLSEERIRNEQLFNPNFVKEVLSLPPRKTLRWHYFMLYFMLLSHMWIEIFEHETL